MLGVSALAIAGCTNLPGSSLGATWGAERYLNGTHGGDDFNGHLASEYTELGRRAAFKDVLWMNSTAYIAKAQQAEAGVTPAPWTAGELGITVPGGETYEVYDELVRVINENKADRPAACARMQAMWDQYLEALRGEEAGSKYCISVEDARAMLREAAIACRPATESGFVAYFGFDETNITDRARQTLDAVVAAVNALGTTALSVVGHTDTVGSVGYNQGLSETRARNVAEALIARGIPAGAMTLAGRSENNLAVATGDNVREPLNRRVEVVLSD
jgi:outer membrane protein OmpA-like peptidoglycan-associated protein